MNFTKCPRIFALSIALMASSASAHGWNLSAVSDGIGPALRVLVGVSDAEGREVENLQARNFTAIYTTIPSISPSLGRGSIDPERFTNIGGGFYSFIVRTNNPQHPVASVRTLGLKLHEIRATGNVPPRPTLVERGRIVIPVRSAND